MRSRLERFATPLAVLLALSGGCSGRLGGPGSAGGKHGAPDPEPPTVMLTQPSTGAQLQGTVTVVATASDNVGVAGVQLLLDGRPLGSELQAPYSYAFDTTGVGNGSYTLSATARDAAGNTAHAPELQITIANRPAPGTANPVLFVTQVPIADDFANLVSTFGTQSPSAGSAPRGGDLYIRYPDGSFKNLTDAACYGLANPDLPANPRCTGTRYPIAVRNPAVDWSGTKAVFSMVVDNGKSALWQLYEVTGFGPNDTVNITKVPNQPPYNNIFPTYGTNGRIIFASDRRRNDEPYQQLDEYDEAPTVSGLWSLDPASGDLFMLNHSPSGSFGPFVDSFGRVIFSRWDHFDRDQQNAAGHTENGDTFPGNYMSESASAKLMPLSRSAPAPEVFPEPWADDQVSAYNDLYYPAALGYKISRQNLVFKQFFPWQINEDGTGEETLNHVGRQEFSGGAQAAVKGDPNIKSTDQLGANKNGYTIDGMLQISEDPLNPGTYYAVDTPEFQTHAAGRIVKMIGPAGMTADKMTLTALTKESSGHYRSPILLSDGTMIAVNTTNTDIEKGDGTNSTYDFRLKALKLSGGVYVPDANLTPGFKKSNVANKVTLWELDPVEVRARKVPTAGGVPDVIAGPEQAMFDQAGVKIDDLRAYLKKNDLALMIVRNVTTRDSADRQQPFNLRVYQSQTMTLGTGAEKGPVYDLAYLQLVQGDMIRSQAFGSGRRVIAQFMHDAPQNPVLELDSKTAMAQMNPALATSAVKIAEDGSVAAFVPARRAMAWQTTDQNGSPVVMERYWITFQPGEIRMCTSCHGINSTDQAGHAPPTNSPLALEKLLEHWKTLPH